MERRKSSFTVGGNVVGGATVGNSMKVPQNSKTDLPYDPEKSLLGIYPKKNVI